MDGLKKPGQIKDRCFSNGNVAPFQGQQFRFLDDPGQLTCKTEEITGGSADVKSESPKETSRPCPALVLLGVLFLGSQKETMPSHSGPKSGSVPTTLHLGGEQAGRSATWVTVTRFLRHKS